MRELGSLNQKRKLYVEIERVKMELGFMSLQYIQEGFRISR